MAETSLVHGTIMHIHELQALGAAAVGRSVRVLGTLVDFDVDRNLVRVEHKGVRLVVDRELVPGLQVQRGSLFQFIGEVTHAQPQLQLRARVARVVDGLDLELYDMALEARRKFEDEMSAVVGSGDGDAAATTGAAGAAATAGTGAVPMAMQQ